MNIKYATVKEIPKHYPGIFSEASIRWLIFNEKENGFGRCIKRIGRKILIDLNEFDKWIGEQKS